MCCKLFANRFFLKSLRISIYKRKCTHTSVTATVVCKKIWLRCCMSRGLERALVDVQSTILSRRPWRDDVRKVLIAISPLAAGRCRADDACVKIAGR